MDFAAEVIILACEWGQLFKTITTIVMVFTVAMKTMVA